MISEVIWQSLYALRGLYRLGIRSLDDLVNWRKFWSDYNSYNMLIGHKSKLSIRYLYPCLRDNTKETQIEPIYFYQDSWAFEKIVTARPSSHVDVGSHHTFVALLSKVIPVTMVDIRPLALTLDTLNFRYGSILDMPYEDNSLSSVSSICVVEHIGLGRYGDPLDSRGSEKAIAELKRIIAPGGDLYISVPVMDQERTYFNAHRVFSEQYLEQLLKPFIIIDRQFINGKIFSPTRRPGFSVGCYHAQKPTDGENG